MSRKRKRKRSSQASRQSRTAAPVTTEEERVEAESAGEAEQKAPQRRGGGLFGPRREPGPYPPFGVTLIGGFRAVGTSPLLLSLAFLSALAAWALYSSIGRPLPPPLIPLLTALPPLHVFIDAQLIFGAQLGALPAFAIAIGVMAARAAFLAAVLLLAIERVRDGGSGRGDALGRLPRTALAIALIYAIEFSLVLGLPLILQTVGGPQLGNLGVMVALVGGLVFLVMAPVVVAAEGVPAQEGMRRGWRAGRLPGGRHFSFVLLYFLFFYYLWTNALGTAGLAPATPTIQSWVLALAATFVHVGVLAGFAYRWLVVRDQVPSGPAPAPGARGRR